GEGVAEEQSLGQREEAAQQRQGDGDEGIAAAEVAPRLLHRLVEHLAEGKRGGERNRGRWRCDHGRRGFQARSRDVVSRARPRPGLSTAGAGGGGGGGA